MSEGGIVKGCGELSGGWGRGWGGVSNVGIPTTYIPMAGLKRMTTGSVAKRLTYRAAEVILNNNINYNIYLNTKVIGQSCL